jgi:Ni/Fe-hydrogenase subunit HybB-like protein
MRRRVSRLFWFETVLSSAAAVFAVLTAGWKDWVEIVFGVDPDHHSGLLEWTVVAAALVVGLCLALAARAELCTSPPTDRAG